MVSATLALTVGLLIAVAVSGSHGNGWSALAAVKATQQYRQSVTSMQLTAAQLDALKTTGQLEVCWVLAHKAGKTREWCAERKSLRGAWRLTGKKKGAKLHINRTSAQLALVPKEAGIEPGLYRWSFTASSCDADAAAEPSAPTADTCSTRLPKSGGQSIRVLGLKPVGCKVKGAAQVRIGPRRGKKVALTFDDGPAPITAQVLNTLKHLNVKATFFMTGQLVGNRREVVRRMLREGHEPANHSWNHADLGAGGAAATAQIRNTNHAIMRAAGFKPCVMRPPYGSTSSDLVRRIRAEGMTSILWDVDPLDWRTPGAGTIAQIIRSRTRAGSIILEHDGGGPRGQTLAAIPNYVRSLKARGYKFVTVSELLGYRTKYRLDR